MNNRKEKMQVGISKKYSNEEAGQIMRQYSKDRGETIEFTVDSSMFTRDFVYNLIKNYGQANEMCFRVTDKDSEIIRLTTTNIRTESLSTIPVFADFIYMLQNQFFSEECNAAICEKMLGMTSPAMIGSWILTIKLYPTIKNLRDAGIKEYRMWTHQEAMRICFAVPIGYANEELLHRETIRPVAATLKPKISQARRNGTVLIYPPSLNKPGTVTCSTGTPSSRLIERSDNGFMACFQLTYIAANNMPKNLLETIFGDETIKKDTKEHVATAISLTDIVRGKGIIIETKVGWNENRTKLERSKVVKTTSHIGAPDAILEEDLISTKPVTVIPNAVYIPDTEIYDSQETFEATRISFQTPCPVAVTVKDTDIEFTPSTENQWHLFDEEHNYVKRVNFFTEPDAEAD